MVTKPTAAEVRVIITTNLTDPQIENVIDDAALMAEVCLSAMSSDRQKAVLKWLAAHLLSMMLGKSGAGANVTSKSIGDASESYATPTLTGPGLMSSSYGQQAIALDPNGCLQNIGKLKMRFRSL
ncbi:MAG: DUF4054 domain-containing protein [Phycisphaerales bacterium]